MWERQPCCAFLGKRKGYHGQEYIICRNGLGEISLSPPGFLWSQMWLMMHLCWNDHCCDELGKWVLWRHRPSSCLGGWPGEGQSVREMEEFGRMHTKPQPLIDSTPCCCSAQPLTSPVTSLLMKERSSMLLLHPTKLDVMLYRKAVQAAGWSPVTQVPFACREHHVAA